jgi:hypothetical protein
MSAMTNAIWPRKSAGSVSAATAGPASLGAGGDSCGQARIQAANPWRHAKANPQFALVPLLPVA